MSLTPLLGQEPGASNDDVSQVSYARTLSWISKTEDGHSDDDLIDTMDCNLGVDLHPVHQLPMATALPISNTSSAAQHLTLKTSWTMCPSYRIILMYKQLDKT